MPSAFSITGPLRQTCIPVGQGAQAAPLPPTSVEELIRPAQLRHLKGRQAGRQVGKQAGRQAGQQPKLGLRWLPASGIVRGRGSGGGTTCTCASNYRHTHSAVTCIVQGPRPPVRSRPPVYAGLPALRPSRRPLPEAPPKPLGLPYPEAPPAPTCRRRLLMKPYSATMMRERVS